MATGEIQDKADEQLAKDLTAIENRLINRLLMDLNLLAVNNNLVFNPDYYATLEDKIVNYMRELGYIDKVNAYLSNYDAVDELAKDFYSRQRLLLENEAIRNPLNEQLRKSTIEALRGQGVAADFVKPLADILRVQALQGLTINQATEQLKARLEKPELVRYAGQVTQDAIMQYDGALNENIAKTYGLKEFIYFSSIIETSRPFCTHMKDKYGSRPIKPEEIKETLDEYCANGIPSPVPITYTTVNNVQRTAQKGSGMIEGTTPGNFAIFKGGHRCRHEVRYVLSGTTARDRAIAFLNQAGL
jgi:hypothetical protein